jgi:CubicO group peptidase (beta-lactamase class C family)
LSDLLAQVDELVDAFVAAEPVPGVAYGLIVDGELVHTRGVGTVKVGAETTPDADTVFRIASMTKSFTAATVLLLRDEGRLQLDDPAASHIPELQGQRPPVADAPAITIRRLLSMSAGFPGDDPWGDRQQDLDRDAFSEFLEGGQSFAFMPGTAFEYSNLGYAILGRVITNVTGDEYRDVVRSRVLEPLGMTSTGYEAAAFPAGRLAIGYARRDDAFVEEPFAGYGAFASMGGLFSTVRDLARWVDGFTRAFAPRGDDAHPLSRASRLEMQQVHRTIDPELTWTSVAELPTVVAMGYGFGTFVRSDMELGTVVAHSGGYPGFGSHMRWHPASGVGVVVLGNRSYFPALKIGDQMLRALVRAEAAAIHRLAPAPALEVARDAVERLLAGWDDDLAAVTFSMNVDMDEPLERRRAAFDRLRETHGPLHRSHEPATSDTPLHAEWWLDGASGCGRVRVEITMDPQAVPKLQHVEVTSVPEPGPLLRAAAEALVAAANTGTIVAVPFANGAHRIAIERDRFLVSALFGPATLGPTTAGGSSSATFRVHAERGALDLALTVDDRGQILTATWIPRPVRPPLSDVR